MTQTAASTDAAPRGADWAHTPERGNALALRIICWIALRCGRDVARLVLHPTALYFLLFAHGVRRRSRRYLGRALERPASARDIYRHIFSFSATVLDRVYLLRDRFELFTVEVRGADAVQAALAEGRGAFLVGAHAGSFEALRAAGIHHGALLPQRIAMVMYPDNARRINDALHAIAPGAAPPLIALGRPRSMLELRDWLDAGGLAGLLADRALHEPASPRSHNVTVPFLGRDAPFNDGPFRLAALLRRRVIFMAGVYGGGARYEARFETLADFSVACADAAERERRIRDALLAYAARLEALCREQPYNWFNFHDFWNEDAR